MGQDKSEIPKQLDFYATGNGYSLNGFAANSDGSDSQKTGDLESPV